MPGLRASGPLTVALRASKLALAVLSGALLAGCAHTTVVGADRTFQLALTEYRLVPQDVRAPAGALTIEVHNYGRLTHDLTLTRGSHPAASTRPIPPGQTARLTLSLSPGSYLMMSRILSDQALGMYGTLNVTR